MNKAKSNANNVRAERHLFEQGKAQLAWRCYHNDCLTPVGAALRLDMEMPYHFLLESVEGGAHRGRYSAIGLYPDRVWRCRGDTAHINETDIFDEEAFGKDDKDVLSSLRAFLDDCALPIPSHLPPMVAGAFGYLSYDMIAHVEPRLKRDDLREDNLAMWEGLWFRPQVMLVFDNVTDELTFATIICPHKNKGMSFAKACAQAQMRLDECYEQLQKPLTHKPLMDDTAWWQGSGHKIKAHMPQEDFIKMVGEAQEYIKAGDIFQVVLSQRFSVPFAQSPFMLYRRLRSLNPSPFLFYINGGAHKIVGSSPEILVRLRDGKMIVRPIAGTRPRGRNKSEDDKLALALKNDPKECAEHLMLLDLGRNDVGKVSKTGSVTIEGQMMIEYYSHVMHMVSQVVGDVRTDIHPLDALLAGFPAGTVSGAPKVRAMELIQQLEPHKRGLYAGCIGYMSAGGTLDSCIALRTGIIHEGMLHVQAGGGIVFESDPLKEWEESKNKASALLKAAGGNFP